MKRQRKRVVIEVDYWDTKEFWRGPVTEANAQVTEMLERFPGVPFCIEELFCGEEDGWKWVPWVRVVYFVPRVVKEELPAVVAMHLCAEPPKRDFDAPPARLSLVYSADGMVH